MSLLIGKKLFLQIIYANHFIENFTKNYVVAAELSGQSMIQTDIDVLQGLLKCVGKILQKVLSKIPRFPERKKLLR